MVFMIITMMFSIAFPTMANAMTGHKSVLRTYVPDHQEGNLIRFDQFSPLLYTIHDGDRIGLTTNYLVAAKNTSTVSAGSLCGSVS